MPKGFFSQGVSLLTNGRTEIVELRRLIEDEGFEVAKEVAAQPDLWFGGPALIIAYRPEVNGYVSIDVVNEPWPDSMGHPKSAPILFGAWSMGYFGPFAYPGALQRAQQHAWTSPGVASKVQEHRGFVRLRTSYAFGLPDNTPVLPPNVNPQHELQFLSRLSLAAMASPNALCYFNPNGEVLLDQPAFNRIWNGCTEQKTLALPLWSNIRFYNLSDRLGFTDTVGNGQLDARDVEAIFPKDRYNPNDIAYYLRNVSHYLLDHGQRIRSTEAIDGPGEASLSWVIELLEKGQVQPPRRVARLHSESSSGEVRAALSAVG